MSVVVKSGKHASNVVNFFSEIVFLCAKHKDPPSAADAAAKIQSQTSIKCEWMPDIPSNIISTTRRMSSISSVPPAASILLPNSTILA